MKTVLESDILDLSLIPTTAPQDISHISLTMSPKHVSQKIKALPTQGLRLPSCPGLKRALSPRLLGSTASKASLFLSLPLGSSLLPAAALLTSLWARSRCLTGSWSRGRRFAAAAQHPSGCLLPLCTAFPSVSSQS